MDTSLKERTQAWIAGDPDSNTAKELQALLDANNEAELKERMAGPLEFGTAGLRGVIGGGESRMNLAVIRRTTQGLANYLSEQVESAKSKGVVIGYDGRIMSREFADEAAAILLQNGFTVHLFSDLAPTPLTAYATTHLNAAAGIMVTASHNPPEYNGYKVYWGDGAQIIPPHDKGIAAAIAKLGAANAIAVDRHFDEHKKNNRLNLLGDGIREDYMKAIEGLSLDRAGRDGLTIVYTPLHGVGDASTREALRRFGFTQVYSVKEQQEPDGRFPTVAFPNPEEKGALDLSLALAREKNAYLVLANDPDADRLAVAVREPNGNYRQLTGNEVGVLLGEYLLRKIQTGGEKRLVMTTIVSSPMLGAIAKKMGVYFGEVLTGFKWIATSAMKREKADGAVFVFGYEEALGYTVGTVARDKDGVGAAAVFAEMTAVALSQGRTIQQELERLAREYGLYVSAQINVTKKGVDGPAQISAIMDFLRKTNPTQFGDFVVEQTRDVKTGVARRGDQTSPLDLPSSNVLMFDLSNGARVIARPSGTEPKIKYYFDLCEKVGENEAFADAQARALSKLEQLKEAFVASIC